MKIGYLLGWINSRLILTLIFRNFITYNSFMRLFGYDPLKRDFKNQIYKENKLNYKVDLSRIFSILLS